MPAAASRRRGGALEQLTDLMAFMSVEELRSYWDDGPSASLGPEDFLRLLHGCSATRAPEDAVGEVGWATGALELFGQMDARGVGSVTWEEFSSFVMRLDLAKGAPQDVDSREASRARQYLRVADYLSDDIADLRKLEYFPGIDRLLALPRSASELVHVVAATVPPRLSSTLRHHSAYSPHTVYCAIAVGDKLVVTSSCTADKNFLTLWTLPVFGRRPSKTTSSSANDGAFDDAVLTGMTPPTPPTEGTKATLLPVMMARVEAHAAQTTLLYSHRGGRIFSAGEADGFVCEWHLTSCDHRKSHIIDGLRFLRQCRLHLFGITSLLELTRRSMRPPHQRLHRRLHQRLGHNAMGAAAAPAAAAAAAILCRQIQRRRS